MTNGTATIDPKDETEIYDRVPLSIWVSQLGNWN
jgi:hypothetical protein